MLISKYEVRDNKKLKFVKKEEASGLLGSLRIKAPKFPLVGPLLF